MAVYQSLAVTQVSQSVTENQSTIRLLWQSTQTGGSYNLTARTAYYYVSVNGAEEVQTAVSYTLPKGSTKTVVDTTLTVPHNDQGEATVTVRTWMDTNISAGVVEQTKSLTLNTIARQSTVSASAGIIGDVSQIAISRQSSDFSHTIAYKFGSLSGYITSAGGVSDTAVKFKKESVNFQLPESFYAESPNARSGTCTLTCRTHSGSSLIGTAQTATFTVRVDQSVCAPTVSGTVVDTNATTVALTGDSSKLVRFCSNALCTITAAAQKNAGSIVTKKIGGKAVSGDTRTVNAIETDSVTFYAKDSRGCDSSATVKSSFVKYIKLTNNASVKRTDATSGKAVISFSGAYFSGSFGAVSNSLTVKYKIGTGSYVTLSDVTVSGGKYSASVDLDNMDYASSYKITVAVSDQLFTVTKALTLKKGTPVFDWGENDFAFHVPVQMDGSLTLKVPLDIACGGTGGTTAAEARKNLGAAPAGLKEGHYFVDTFQELETTISEVYAEMGDYTWRNMIVSIGGTVYDVRLWRCKADYGTAQIGNYNGSLTCRKRTLYGGVWQEWEWPDPPMSVGTEYRTTQRWQRKAVYTKLVNVGNLPNSTTKTVAHNAAAVQIIRFCGQASDGTAFPIVGSFGTSVELWVGKENIQICTNADCSELTATVQLWYTKE